MAIGYRAVKRQQDFDEPDPDLQITGGCDLNLRLLLLVAILCVGSGLSGYFARDLLKKGCSARESWHRLHLSCKSMRVAFPEQHLSAY